MATLISLGAAPAAGAARGPWRRGALGASSSMITINPKQQQRRSRLIATAAANEETRGGGSSSSSSSSGASGASGGSGSGERLVPDFAPVVPLGGDAYILRSFAHPADREAPRFDLDVDAALRLQLDALARNNKPCPDHGVEVMYRFASFDPFERSRYFGRSFDLGQFERFRRVWHHPGYRTLLNHDSAAVVGRFTLGEGKVALRVLARRDHPMEERSYTITMVQRQGGPHDGYWMTESVVCDGLEWDTSIVSW